MKQPPLDALPRLPRDADGPVFHAPWQAEAFALAVALNARGVFSWTRWAAVLAEELARAEASPLPGAQHTHPGDDYFQRWLAALERLVGEAALAGPEEIRSRAQAIEAARAQDHRHPHGDDDRDHDHGPRHHHDHDDDHGDDHVHLPARA
jgi:nitrile hydratase accessory protein